MATELSTQLMTTDEFLQLADKEGLTRELIDGVLVEREMTTRSPKHGIAMIRIGTALTQWLDSQASRQGIVGGGEIRCRLATDPDLIVGIDVAFYEGAEFVRQSEVNSYIDGPPVVAVEVLSATDTHENVVEKIRRYLSAGVKQVWIADPDLRTMTVHRGKDDSQHYNAGEELPGDPELPGFRVKVSELFTATA